MKALIISGTAFLSSLCALTAVADHHSAPMIGGVEVFGCDFEIWTTSCYKFAGTKNYEALMN